MIQARDVQSAHTLADASRLSKFYGIKNISILSCLDSIRFPTSFPYDFMHLIWENLIKNLIFHWTGEFKDLDQGHEHYELPQAVWQAIGAATDSSGATIPSVYGSRVPNIATPARSNCSAEMWSFWTLYLGPILLRSHFKHPKYFKHFLLLVRLLNICLQFEISDTEIEEVRQGFIRWVLQYEEYVLSNATIYLTQFSINLESTTSIPRRAYLPVPSLSMPYYILQTVLPLLDLFGVTGRFLRNVSVASSHVQSAAIDSHMPLWTALS
jgi:hypothetical protein